MHDGLLTGVTAQLLLPASWGLLAVNLCRAGHTCAGAVVCLVPACMVWLIYPALNLGTTVEGMEVGGAAVWVVAWCLDAAVGQSGLCVDLSRSRVFLLVCA